VVAPVELEAAVRGTTDPSGGGDANTGGGGGGGLILSTGGIGGSGIIIIKYAPIPQIHFAGVAARFG